MRVVRVLLFLALSGAVAHADDAKAADSHPADAAAPPRARVPLRVVRMLPETKQALLFDRTKGTHVVVEAGQTVEGYFVDALEDDEVTLLSDNGATVVLAAPDPAWRHHRDGDHTADRAADAGTPGAKSGTTASPAPTSAAPASAAPTTTAKPGEPQPADPYADLAVDGELGTGADGVRVVEAPDAPAMAPTSAGSVPAGSSTAPVLGTGADGVRVVEAPGSAAAVPVPAHVPAPAPAAAPAPVAASAAAPVPIASASTASAPHDPAGDALAAALTGTAPTSAPGTSTASPADGPVLLARADVNAALASFGTLTGSIRAAFTPAGARIDSVAADSLFAKAGLRAGDVVSAVNGAPLRSLDDAADLYARAGTAKAVSVAVVRGGKPITLRVSIQ